MKTSVCSGCGKRLPPGSQSCPNCGCKTAVAVSKPSKQGPPARYCDTCGKHVSDDNVFCPHCGAQLGKKSGSLIDDDFRNNKKKKVKEENIAVTFDKSVSANKTYKTAYTPKLGSIYKSGSPEREPARNTAGQPAARSSVFGNYSKISGIFLAVLLVLQIANAILGSAAINSSVRKTVVSRLTYKPQMYLDFARTDKKNVPRFIRALDFVIENPELEDAVSGYIAGKSELMMFETSLDGVKQGSPEYGELEKRIRALRDGIDERVDKIVALYGNNNEGIRHARYGMYFTLIPDMFFSMLVCAVIARIGTSSDNTFSRVFACAMPLLLIVMHVVVLALEPQLRNKVLYDVLSGAVMLVYAVQIFITASAPPVQNAFRQDFREF